MTVMRWVSSGADPRQRGGTLPTSMMLMTLPGLSPPARGNRSPGPYSSGVSGPIPANAGEPSIRSITPPPPRAYPRQRGGTNDPACGVFSALGLSPPARGNRPKEAEKPSSHGPIPASAGEPSLHCRWRNCGGAYPRQRGGTDAYGVAALVDEGLSPPARGNQMKRGDLDKMSGPIPASAGEPSGGGLIIRMWGAYPRQRGGTAEPLRLS